VLVVATDLIDDVGLGALTMRGLAGRLGVQAMALYHYVEGREDLLEGVVSGLVSRLGPELLRGGEDAAGDWPTHIRNLAVGVRGLAREHPNVVPLMLRSFGGDPWLPPPLGRELATDLVRALVSAGFTRSRAVTAHRAFSRFLLGHLAFQTAVPSAQQAAHTASTAGADMPSPSADDRDGLGSQPTDESEFGWELRSLIERLSQLHGR